MLKRWILGTFTQYYEGIYLIPLNSTLVKTVYFMLHIFYYNKNKIWKKEKTPHQNSQDATKAVHVEKCKAQVLLEKQLSTQSL